MASAAGISRWRGESIMVKRVGRRRRKKNGSVKKRQKGWEGKII